MKIDDVPFLVAKTKTYTKEFGIAKTILKENGYQKDSTLLFLNNNKQEENLQVVSKHLNSNSLLISVPNVKRDGVTNSIPKAYASFLSQNTKVPFLDLNEFVLFEKENSNRSSNTAALIASNNFSFKFRDKKLLALFEKFTKGKEIILVDDVITTGETIVHLGNYLKAKLPGITIKGGTAMVSNGIRKPSTRDAWRFAKKLSILTGDKIPLVELQKIVGEQFGPYTRLKMARFERGVQNPDSAFRAIETMDMDNNKVQQNLQKSLDYKEPFPKNKNDIER